MKNAISTEDIFKLNNNLPDIIWICVCVNRHTLKPDKI